MNSCPNSPPITSNPSQDSCAQQAIQDETALHNADPSRTIWGTFTKDLFPWQEWPPTAWNSANCGSGTTTFPDGNTGQWNGCFEKHQSMLMSGLNIAAADIYGWTDPYEGIEHLNRRLGHCAGTTAHGSTPTRLTGSTTTIRGSHSGHSSA